MHAGIRFPSPFDSGGMRKRWKGTLAVFATMTDEIGVCIFAGSTLGRCGENSFERTRQVNNLAEEYKADSRADSCGEQVSDKN